MCLLHLAQEVSVVRQLPVFLFSHWWIDITAQLRNKVEAAQHFLWPGLGFLMETVIQGVPLCCACDGMWPFQRVSWTVIILEVCLIPPEDEIFGPRKFHFQGFLLCCLDVFLWWLAKSSIIRLKKLLFCSWCVLQHDQQYPKCKCLEGLQSLKGHLHGPLHSLAREVGNSSRQQSECSPCVVHHLNGNKWLLMLQIQEI